MDADSDSRIDIEIETDVWLRRSEGRGWDLMIPSRIEIPERGFLCFEAH